jgi:hypothetical protein
MQAEGIIWKTWVEDNIKNVSHRNTIDVESIPVVHASDVWTAVVNMAMNVRVP